MQKISVLSGQELQVTRIRPERRRGRCYTCRGVAGRDGPYSTPYPVCEPRAPRDQALGRVRAVASERRGVCRSRYNGTAKAATAKTHCIGQNTDGLPVRRSLHHVSIHDESHQTTRDTADPPETRGPSWRRSARVQTYRRFAVPLVRSETPARSPSP